MAERGLVTGVGSRSVRVFVDGIGTLRCTLRGTLWPEAEAAGLTRPVAVGDRVELEIEGDEGAVCAVEPRRNRLSRQAATGHAAGGRGRDRDRQYGGPPPVQVIAANLDRILVVASLNDPPFRPGLVDRFLVAAAAEEIDATLVLNKVDLPGEPEVVQPWRDAGVHVICTSTETGEGIDELAPLLRDGICLLVGHSGVGKSSLLNAVDPTLKLDTGEVTLHHGRGRHTTTHVSLLPLEGGGWVVDSPGIRAFGLEDVPLEVLARLFPGFGDLPHDCKFRDCLHREEPGCAVIAAAENGTLDEDRFETYERIRDDLAAGEG
ncbi:MAG: putative ribosome biogenesis GTPase RsgA [Planctomycetota bacterium]|nr:MAG: putative ribosome biogenesis GTPase RsgA [Planctomycetota bacterium]